MGKKDNEQLSIDNETQESQEAQEEVKRPDDGFPNPVINVPRAFMPGYECVQEGERYRVYYMNKLLTKGNLAADRGGADSEQALIEIAKELGVYR